jgi:hypothetical protein
MRKER